MATIFMRSGYQTQFGFTIKQSGNALTLDRFFPGNRAELLDGGDDDLVGVIVGKQAADEAGGVGVFLHATFLELVELIRAAGAHPSGVSVG